jgi:hypothetical protein
MLSICCGVRREREERGERREERGERREEREERREEGGERRERDAQAMLPEVCGPFWVSCH